MADAYGQSPAQQAQGAPVRFYKISAHVETIMQAQHGESEAHCLHSFFEGKIAGALSSHTCEEITKHQYEELMAAKRAAKRAAQEKK
jgi:hypothetical protein